MKDEARTVILVVGASGYIGSVLLQKAAAFGTVIGTSSAGCKRLLRLRLEAPQEFDYDLLNAEDLVLVTAAISGPDTCGREQDWATAVNVTGTSVFIENALARGARVVFFSSDTVYGERADDFDERAPCSPAGEYAQMKWAVEKRFRGHESFKAIRLSYVFSRDDKFTRYLTACAARDHEAELFHPFRRAIVHRDDVVEGILALGPRWDEVAEQAINFGGPKTISRIEFAEHLRKNHLHQLRFRVTEPTADFFDSRPRVIAMTSPTFAELLGRPPRTLEQAAAVEFPSQAGRLKSSS